MVSDVAYSNIGASIFARTLSSSDAELKAGISGSVNSKDAFLNTLGQFGNGTQAMVGAVQWRARLVGKDLNVVVYNKMGLNSMALHATAPLGIPDMPRYFQGHKYSNVHQYFQWSWRYRN